jgi:hypothetical protein
MSELKPCPWCGGRAISYDERHMAMECAACLAFGPFFGEDIGNHKDGEAMAVIAWNTRAPDWQDISTAPRDGTPFLAFLTVRNTKTGETWPEMNVIWADDDDGCPDWERGWRFEDYTHWMPLPASPKEVG